MCITDDVQHEVHSFLVIIGNIIALVFLSVKALPQENGYLFRVLHWNMQFLAFAGTGVKNVSEMNVSFQKHFPKHD